MREFQEKRRIRKKIYSIPILVILALLLALMVKATWNVYWKREESSRKLQETREEFAKVEARKAMLEEGIRTLQTEEGVEKEIREKFRMAREGEEVIVILDSEEKKSNNVREESWWEKVKALFK